jgi:hypothetical protein
MDVDQAVGQQMKVMLRYRAVTQFRLVAPQLYIIFIFNVLIFPRGNACRLLTLLSLSSCAHYSYCNHGVFHKSMQFQHFATLSKDLFKLTWGLQGCIRHNPLKSG